MKPPAPITGSNAGPGQRNAYIDTLRGVAIFGVACIHFGGSFVTVSAAWTPSFYLGLFFGQIFNFAVPLFIFLSGVLAEKSASSKPPRSLWAYYQSRLIRIVLPYLAASIASFFLLNHYLHWKDLPDLGAQLGWLVPRLVYYGVEPTLYFIPLILQLYLLQPILRSLPRWTHFSIGKIFGRAPKQEHVVLGLALLFLAIHITLGVLCYHNTLSYYDWCRPCSLFWMVYFFCGLHFKTIHMLFTRRQLQIMAGVALLISLGALISDGLYLTDRNAVGANFELNHMDIAYARPQLLIYDLAITGALAVGIALGWTWRATVVSFLGQYTLEIYLWHIIVLYEGAWRFFEVMESCRRLPELILIIAAAACFIIAGAKHQFTKTSSLLRQYRLVLVKKPW